MDAPSAQRAALAVGVVIATLGAALFLARKPKARATVKRKDDDAPS